MSLRRLALSVLCAVLAFPAAAAPPQPAAKVDGPDEHGVTAITYAIVENSFNAREVIRALLKTKASVNPKSEDGRTPLMFAAQDGKNAHFGDLLAAGADLNAVDNDNWTALMYAAFYSSSFGVNDLLKAGADPKSRPRTARRRSFSPCSTEIRRASRLFSRPA